MNSSDNIVNNTDAIVVLASQNWSAASLDAQYQHIRYLAKEHLIVFVQADLKISTYFFEDTGHSHIRILHIYRQYGEMQSELLKSALHEKKLFKTLLWIYNDNYIHYIETAYSAFIVYESTRKNALNHIIKSKIKSVILSCSDAVICSLKDIKKNITTFNLTKKFILNKEKTEKIINHINELSIKNQTREQRRKKFNILFLYDAKYIYIKTIKEYISSFEDYSHHNIYCLPGTAEHDNILSLDFSKFDIIMVHYSIRLCIDDGNCTFSAAQRQKLHQYKGYKVLFIQDEYEHTNLAKAQMKYLGFHLIYTCVPQQYIENVYPKSEFPNTEFIPILTGYVSEEMKRFHSPALETRPLDICYRGTQLPYWYGNLGQEKTIIGVKVKEYAKAKGLNIDIEWDPARKIFGDNWYPFLASAKATLGSESGSNLFDFNGTVRANVEAYIESIDNKATYEDVYQALINPHDNYIKMNQISPKMFEAIALGTVLILFEGSYSNILVADYHYISLKKDFSNIEDVFAKIRDIEYLKTIATQAKQDIVDSGKYSYQHFVDIIDQQLEYRVLKAFYLQESIDLSKAFIYTYEVKPKEDIPFKTKFSIRYQLSPPGLFYRLCVALNKYVFFLLPILRCLKRIIKKIRNYVRSIIANTKAQMVNK